MYACIAMDDLSHPENKIVTDNTTPAVTQGHMTGGAVRDCSRKPGLPYPLSGELAHTLLLENTRKN